MLLGELAYETDYISAFIKHTFDRSLQMDKQIEKVITGCDV